MELLLQSMAMYIDARALSILPHKAGIREQQAIAGSRGVALRALGGDAWPASDHEWDQGKAFMETAFPPGRRKDEITTIDGVVEYMAQVCMFALGVKVDQSAIHEHIGP